MRVALLIVTVAFLCALAALIGYDVAHQGITVLAVLAVLMMALIGIPIVGALSSRNQENIHEKLAEHQEHRRMWDEGPRI